MNVLAPSPRQADHAIDPLFLNRHSPRSFTDATLTEAELLELLEAARWAPSASNNQPWRFAWGLRGDAGFAKIADTLVPFNRAWAEKASALVVIASKSTVEKEGQSNPNPWHAFDAGAAWMSLALQANLKGLFVHAMGGFDQTKAADLLGAPQGYVLHAVVAIGSRGPAENLPEALRAREGHTPRLPLAELAKHGSF